MKLIACLAVLIALAAARSIKEQTFRTDREYLYKYEGQTLTGIPRSSEFYSGLKIKSNVRLQFLSNGKNVAMQLENIELYMLNAKVLSPEQLEQPESMFQRVAGSEEQEMIRELSKPIVFSYSQGLVEELKVEAEEPHWSVNTKRGIVNLFIVNLQERRLIEEESPLRETPLRESTSQHSYFRSMEKGVLGECEAVYEVLEGQWQPRVEEQNSNVLNVTKVYNMTNCLQKPIFQQNIFNSQACPRCHEEKPELIQRGLQVRYNISGNRQQYMIESVISESQYIFTPYKEQGGSIVTFINQTMYLIQSGEKSKIIEQPKQPMSKAIIMEIPELFEQYSWLFNEPSPKRDSRQVIPTAEILQLVQKIEEELKKPELQMEVPTFILRLVSVLRELYPEQLRELYQQSKSKLLHDVLPFIGTRPAIQLLLELVERQERSAEYAAQALQAVAHYGYPTEKIIDQLIRIAEKSQRQQIRRSAWFTVGSLLYQLVQIPQHHLSKPLPFEQSQWMKIQQRLSQLHEKYAEMLIQQLQKSDSEDHKVVILKTIGNAGLVRTLPILKKMIHEQKQSLRVRVYAIGALRRIAPIVPEEILNILLPIFKNQLIDPELRIAAFQAMISCQPELTTMQLFSQWLHREQNKQVGSYVFSTLRTLANSTHPCYKRLARHARIALRFGTPIRPGMLHSKNWHFSYMNDKFQLGGFVELRTVGQEESVFPKWIVGRLNTQIFGKSLDAVEINVRAEGIQSLIDRMFNRHAKKQHDLPIKPRTLEEVEPKVDIYFKLFGNEHRFWSFDGQYIQQLMQKQTPIKQFYEQLLQRPIQYTKTYMMFDGTVKIPTLFGLPLCMNVTSAAVLRVEGKMEEARFERASKKVVVAGEMKPTISMEIEGRMGIDAVLIKTGTAIKVRVQTHTPYKGKIEIDVANKQMKNLMQLQQREHNLVEVEVLPMTFVELPRRMIKSEPLVQIIKGVKINPVQVRERVFGERATGIQFTLKREFVPRNFTRFAPFHPLTGRQHIVIKYQPGQQMPQEVETVIQYSRKWFEEPVTSVEAFSDEQNAFSSEEDEQNKDQKIRYALKSKQFQAIFESESESDSSSSSSSSSSESESDSQSDEYTTKQPFRRHDEQEPIRRQREQEPTRRLFKQEPFPTEDPEDSSSSSESDSSSSSSSESDSNSWEDAKQKSWTTVQPKKFRQQTFQSKSLQHKLTIAIRTNGGLRRFLNSQLVWTHDQQFSEHQIQMILERTPIRRIEKEEWQLYFKGQMSLPQFSGKWNQVPKEEQAHGLFQIQWGQKSQSPKKTISITINAQRSQEQIRAIQSLPQREAYTILKQQCEQDRKINAEISKACEDVMLFESTLNQILIQVDYQREQIPRWVRHMSQAVLRLAHSKLWKRAKVMDTVSNKPNTIRLAFTVANNMQVADLVVKMPKMNVMFKRIPLFTQVHPMVVRRSSMHYFLQRITGDYFRPYCKIMNNEVRTFDNVTFELPKTTEDCEMVLSKDCSSYERYTVMMQQTRGNEKVIRILADGVEIKMKRTAPHEYEIYVDGKIYRIPVNEVQIYEKSLTSQKKLRVQMKNTEATFIVAIKPTGITVYFDGENIMIEVSQMYRNKQCGVCGDYNGEKEYEFVGPQEEIYQNEKHFALSYLLPNNKCDVPRIQQQHKLPKLPKF